MFVQEDKPRIPSDDNKSRKEVQRTHCVSSNYLTGFDGVRERGGCEVDTRFSW